MMESPPLKINYRAKKLDNTTLVWLECSNRYIQMEAPAYEVFRFIAGGRNAASAVRHCMEKYQLPPGASEKFVSEITGEILALLETDPQVPKPEVPMKEVPAAPLTGRGRTIHIWGKSVCMRFQDPALEQYILPQFLHLETPGEGGQADLSLEFFREGDMGYMVVNGMRAYRWKRTDAHYMKGALAMQMVNLLHQKTEDSWMGVFHASAVSRGNRALLFPAATGSGKSTLAAMLMGRGCTLVSDDFTPVDKAYRRVYPYPGAISLKAGALPVLRKLYPELNEIPDHHEHSRQNPASWVIPKQAEAGTGKGIPVAALVFVRYTGGETCDFRKVSHLEVLNEFLSESWLEHSAEAADHFMDWYFRIPCYRMRYGDSEAAVSEVMRLIDHVP